MLNESKILVNNLDHYFKRRYQWHYHILIVDNHFFNCYSFFLQAHQVHAMLTYSHDLLEIPRNKALYEQVLHDLKCHTKLSIEYRNTHHLVHPGKDVNTDLNHGH